jgi:hypothetical protein
MGGKAKSRDDFLHWFAGVEEFEYELETQRLHREIEAAKEGAAQDEGAKRQAYLETAQQLSTSKRDLELSFKVIGTMQMSAREHALAALKQQLAEAMHTTDGQDTDTASRYAESVKGARTMRSISESSTAEEVEARDSEGDAVRSAAKEERYRLYKAVKRFRHQQGEHAPVSRLIEQLQGVELPPGWGLVEGDAALCMMYNGVMAQSPLSRYGTQADFSRIVGNKMSVTPSEGAQGSTSKDRPAYFRGEVVLCSTDKAHGTMQPPDSLVIINAPDIMPARLDGSETDDIFAVLRDKLAPHMKLLLEAMRAFDEDGNRTIDRTEFGKALDSMGLDPPLSKADASLIFDRLDPDGNGSVEYEDFELLLYDDSSAGPAPYDQARAFDVMGDCADMIVLLLDAKNSRFNTTELAIIKALYAKHRHKMRFACVENQSQRDALARTLGIVLDDRSVESLPSVSIDSPLMLSFVNGTINPQQNQVRALAFVHPYLDM